MNNETKKWNTINQLLAIPGEEQQRRWQMIARLLSELPRMNWSG